MLIAPDFRNSYRFMTKAVSSKKSKLTATFALRADETTPQCVLEEAKEEEGVCEQKHSLVLYLVLHLYVLNIILLSTMTHIINI